MPEISEKYEQLICVAGITESGDWRRIYPIPWEKFWKGSETKFSKKNWIEYELRSTEPSDHRPESRKIDFDTIKPLNRANFKDIESLLNERLTTIEQLESKSTMVNSLGVVKPYKVSDFAPTENKHYKELVTRKAQKDLFGNDAINIDIPKYKYRYIFNDGDKCRGHEMLCEDWEVSELYRHCEDYRKRGKYKDKEEVHQKVKEKMLNDLFNKFRRDHVKFIVGSHYRFNTYMIVGVIYPKKAEVIPEYSTPTKN